MTLFRLFVSNKVSLSFICLILFGLAACNIQISQPQTSHQIDTTEISICNQTQATTADDFVYNLNYERRDELIGIDVIWGENDAGGIVLLHNLSLSTLDQLSQENFLNLADQQNVAPTAGEIVSFMCKYPAVAADGYAVSPQRDDYRISIDGLFVNDNDVNADLKSSFSEFCFNADEIYLEDDLYCWWD